MPHDLLPVLCFLITLTSAIHTTNITPTVSPTSISSSQIGVGQFIAQGLGVDTENSSSTAVPSSHQSSVTPTISSSTILPSASASYTNASIPLGPIPYNATQAVTALSCFSPVATWWYESSIFTAAHTAPITSYNTTTTNSYSNPTSTTSYPSGNLSVYTLCDGSPRVDISPVSITSIVTNTSTAVFPTTVFPTYTVPLPCNLTNADCEELYYDTPLGGYWGNLSDAESNFTFPILLKECGDPVALDTPCLIGGGPVRLLYFPVTTVSGDLCLGNGSTVTPTPTGSGPNTVQTLGTTFTSGSAYLSFEVLSATYDGFYNPVGPILSNIIIGFPSSAISSQCLTATAAGKDAGTSLNFADLNFPPPASAYDCMGRCYTTFDIAGSVSTLAVPPECETIWNDFHPNLAVPTAVRDLVPAWSTCSFYDWIIPNDLFDPPIALTEVSAAATPTLSDEPPPPSTPASVAGPILTSVPQTAQQESLSVSVTSSYSSTSSIFVVSLSSVILETSSKPEPVSQSEPASASPSTASSVVTVVAQLPSAVTITDSQAVSTLLDGSDSTVSLEAVETLATTAPVTVVETIPIAGVSEEAATITSSSDPAAESTIAIFTAGSQTITASAIDPTVFAIGTNTVTVGGDPTVIEGFTLSAASNGVQISDSLYTYSSDALSATGASPEASSFETAAVFTEAGQTYTAQAISSAVVLGSQTISVGGAPITTSGVTISAIASNVIVVGSSTVSLAIASAAATASASRSLPSGPAYPTNTSTANAFSSAGPETFSTHSPNTSSSGARSIQASASTGGAKSSISASSISASSTSSPSSAATSFQTGGSSRRSSIPWPLIYAVMSMCAVCYALG